MLEARFSLNAFIFTTEAATQSMGRNQRQPAVNLRAHACFRSLSKYWHRNDKIVVKSKESSFKVYFISLKAI